MVSSTPRPQFTPGKDPVPISQEAGWAPGPVWTGGKSRPHRDSIPDRPARSQSLYRLSYRAPKLCRYILQKLRNNLRGQVYHLLLSSHVRSAKQPIITGVASCHIKVSVQGSPQGMPRRIHSSNTIKLTHPETR